MKKSSRIFSRKNNDRILSLSLLLVFSLIVSSASRDFAGTAAVPVGKTDTANDSIPVLIPYPSPTIERKPLLQWHTPAVTVTSYHIQIATDTSFTTPVIFVSVADTQYAPTIDLPIDTIYWRVNADESDWSETGSFIINDGRIPVLIPPDSLTIERKPVFQWYTPPVSVDSFSIQIATDSLFSAILIDTTITDTQYVPTADLPIDTLYWRVRGDDSDWSDILSFLIVDGRIPVLIPYEDPTFEQRPTLQWYTPPMQTDTFTIQIASDSLFNTILITTPVTDTQYTPEADLPFGKTYWRVKSDDSEYSAVSSFNLKDYRVPLLIPYVPKLTNETQPTLTWTRVDSVQNYTIEIDNNSDFSSTLISLPLSDTAFVPFTPLPLGDIYWRVKSDRVATWSDVDHFTILPDTIPLLVQFNGDTIYEKQPTFAWHPVQDAESYRFLLADNSDFNEAIIVLSQDTMYTPDIALESGQWFWKVSCSKNLDVYSFVDSVIIYSVTGINRYCSLTKPINHCQTLPGSVRIVLSGFSYTDITADVYTTRGRIVSRLKPSTGKNRTLVWDYKDFTGTAVSSGMYLIIMRAGGKEYIHKVLVKK